MHEICYTALVYCQSDPDASVIQAPQISAPLRLLLFLTLMLASACVSGQQDGSAPGPDEVPTITVGDWAPTDLLPGSTVRVSGTNLRVVDQVRLDGALDGQSVTVSIAPTEKSDTHLVLQFGEAVFAAIGAKAGHFEGDLDFLYRGVVIFTTVAEFEFSANLRPSIKSLGESVVYLGDELVVAGGGFLLPGEGRSELLFDGVLKLADSDSVIPISKTSTRLMVSARGDARMTLSPELLGVLPGTFKGGIFIRNVSSDGSTLSSNSLSVDSLVFKPTRIDGLTPEGVSRGELLTIFGRGFIGTDPDSQSTTLLVLEGTLHTRDGVEDFTGQKSLQLVPRQIRSNTVMEYVFRVRRNSQGNITGLGSTAGRFDGTIGPLVLHRDVAYWGPRTPISLTIKPPRQVVYLRYLPGFSEAMTDFGLADVEREVRDRIMAVVQRDYAGVNIRFEESEPVDYVEFATVEIGGVDPNRANLFGIDNTCHGQDCKDIGNLHLDDLIGGLNAVSQQQGYYAYGGIFLASFFQFSPTLATEALSISSTRFDDIFGFCVPLLGGTAVTRDELNGGNRTALVQEAIRVLGNLVGTTVTHEVGHSLGLAALEGRFHNEGDNPGWIMDTGINRSFEERAEIDGAPAPTFSPYNLAYLKTILPLEPN